jgi:signal transduction histidine kinase
MGALGLYCDLMSMPGVLKPEHQHYPEELRLLGTRSGALIERLMQALLAPGGSECGCPGAPGQSGEDGSPAAVRGRMKAAGTVRRSRRAVIPVSLYTVVERSSGLLSPVAGGRSIEIVYGAAAMVPVRVAEDAVERILVNLVRNSAAALQGCGPARGSGPDATPCTVFERSSPERECSEDMSSSAAPIAIRIEVGLLVNRVGDEKPWPFRRVRLTVEDSGCGMEPEQLDRLLCGTRAPSRGSHGIGFRVVRDLVTASDGDLRVMSAPGAGTRVQIEWPVAVDSVADTIEPTASPGSAGHLGANAERRHSS